MTEAPAKIERKRNRWFRRRTLVLPTWRSCLFLGIGVLLLFELAIHKIHPFLAITRPVPSTVLVVEGWAPDYAYDQAIAEFHRGHYQLLVVTGGPFEEGAPLAEYKSYAEFGAAILLKLGLATNEVVAVPSQRVRQDRTYASALALKDWLAAHNLNPAGMNLMTLGPHARRSRLLFHKAFGKGVSVGAISVPPQDYDPKHWWRSSQGVRVVMSESIAYSYASLFFHPKRP